MAVSKSFTALGRGDTIEIKAGESFIYSVSGTFGATYQLLEYAKGVGFAPTRIVATGTTATSGTIVNRSKQTMRYGFGCSAFTSGTMVTTVTELSSTNSNKLIANAGVLAKAGATAGWTVAAGANIALATCAASSTAATLVVPITGLKVGQKITGFHLIGQIESAGGTVTVDAQLRKHTSAAADVADALVGSITQVSVTADTILSASNSLKDLTAPEVVGEDETFYVLVTATTAASTDVALQGVALLVADA